MEGRISTSISGVPWLETSVFLLLLEALQKETWRMPKWLHQPGTQFSPSKWNSRKSSWNPAAQWLQVGLRQPTCSTEDRTWTVVQPPRMMLDKGRCWLDDEWWMYRRLTMFVCSNHGNPQTKGVSYLGPNGSRSGGWMLNSEWWVMRCLRVYNGRLMLDEGMFNTWNQWWWQKEMTTVNKQQLPGTNNIMTNDWFKAVNFLPPGN